MVAVDSETALPVQPEGIEVVILVIDEGIDEPTTDPLQYVYTTPFVVD